MRILSFLMAFTLWQCSPKTDHQQDISEILALQQQQRNAHLSKNVDLFVSEFDSAMVQINRGVVSIFNREKDGKRIQHYFDSVEFIRWDDIHEPKVKISDDGTMAYAIIEKLVVLAPVGERDNISAYDTTRFAWVAIYQKKSGEWKLQCNVSTNQ